MLETRPPCSTLPPLAALTSRRYQVNPVAFSAYPKLAVSLTQRIAIHLDGQPPLLPTS